MVQRIPHLSASPWSVVRPVSALTLLCAACSAGESDPSDGNTTDTGATSEPRVLVGAIDDVLFGRKVAPVGDFDGDGFGDVALAAYDLSIGAATGIATEDRVYVVAGPVDAPSSVAGNVSVAAVATLARPGLDEFGRVIGAAGDVNRDGVDDLWTGSFEEVALVLGGKRGGIDASAAPIRILGAGFSEVAHGDADGDGIVDVLVSGVPGDGRLQHDAYVILGVPAGPVTAAWGDAFMQTRHDACGVSVAAPAVDLDGDGSHEWLLRSVECVEGPTLFGVSATQSGVNDAAEAEVRVLDGTSVRSVVTVDVDGDGFSDVGALSSSGVWVMPGPFDGSPDEAVATVELVDDRSVVLAALGDTDGDGRASLLIGDADGPGSEVRLIEGFSSGTATLVDFPLLFEHEAYSGPLGIGAGHDLDRDGVEDVAIGVPERDAIGANGVVYLFSGASLADYD